MSNNHIIKVGIIGGAGYTAGELIRILLNHNTVKISFIHSNSNYGKKICDIHTDLLGDIELFFDKKIDQDIDILFLCSGHGKSKKILNENFIPEKVKIVDLSNDFRLKSNSSYKNRTFIYGLPELNKNRIENAENVANPGCFATAIQLALLPLAANQMLQDDIHIFGITGSTGAGYLATETTHFSWRSNNVSVYKPFVHQHLSEITESIHQLQNNFKNEVNFIPIRGNFTRGILSTIYTKTDLNNGNLFDLYKQYYKNVPFTIITKKNVSLKDVINTNKCILKIEKKNDYIFITSIIDNLIKGASGQAVQNMNLMFGLEEQTGLKLKSIMF